MVTVTRGEVIELNIRIETRMVKISFFACFCSSSNSRISVFNHYSRQFDLYFETLRALAGKHRNCEKISTKFHRFCMQLTHTKLSFILPTGIS